MRRSNRSLRALLSLALAGPAMAQPAAPKPIDLPGARLHSESLSIAANGMAYVGSVTGGVLRVALATGKVEQWIKPGDFGSGAVFGVLVDPVNGLLWTCSNDFSAAGIVIAGADKGSWLKGFDLRSGEGRLSYKLPGERPMCNDIAVARDGTIYATDTNASHILRLKPGARALESWSADPALARASDGSGLDGIAIGGDGQLYVNNLWTNLLARVEVKADGSAGKVTPLQSSRAFSMPDGLRSLGGMRFAQAEGTGKIGIVTVVGDKATVETVAEGLSTPTGVDISNGTLWYVQAEISYIFNPTLRDKMPPPFKLTPISQHSGH